VPAWVNHLVVVDGNSSDATIEKVEVLGDPRVEIARHATTQGVGGSVLDGHRRGRELHGSSAATSAWS